jgi:hypothetical protein
MDIWSPSKIEEDSVILLLEHEIYALNDTKCDLLNDFF